MDNSDFLPYIRVAKLPECVPLLNEPSVETSSISYFSWLKKFIGDIRRFFYKNLHDFLCSSIFGCLTLNEQLYIAVHENNLYKAKELLFWGAHPSFIPWDAEKLFSHLVRDPRRRKINFFDRSLFNSIIAMDSMLYMAVSSNNFALVKELTSHHDYGSIDEHSEVVSLCLAVQRGEIDLVKHLIDVGHINPNDHVLPNCKHCKTDPNAVQSFKTPLYHACHRNHWSLVKYLIESKNCDVNQLTSTFESCLHGAILGAVENPSDSDTRKHQRYRIVKYLLSQTNCNPNLGVNPLCIGLLHDSLIDYTSLLIQNDCNVDRIGWNMFDRSNITHHKSNCVMPYLLDHPLNICLRQMLNLRTEVSSSNFYVLRRYAILMIERQANVYAMYDYGSLYPFVLAVRLGDKTLIEKIIVHCRDFIQPQLSEPLIQAATRSCNEIVGILIRAGFSPNQIQPFQDSRRYRNISLDKMTSSDVLNYLDRYCSKNIETCKGPEKVHEDQPTAFSALMRMPSWIFHSDQYFTTIETLRELTFTEGIDMKIRANRTGFSEALINEYYPFVYYCLENLAPIDLNDSQIEFRRFRSQNQFCFTLFHLISLCSRLTSKRKVQKVLFESFESFVSRFLSTDQQTAKKAFVYLDLWFNDEDFFDDPVLFEHLVDFSQLNGIFGENFPNFKFNEKFYDLIAARSTRKKLLSLKQISREKIRRQTQIYSDRNQVNLLILLEHLSNRLPKSLIQYLFYTQCNRKSLINFLIDRKSWDSIPWI